MDKETVREQLRDYAEMTERAIDSYLPETECLQKNVILAARHSLTAGGKRLRPALVMEFCRVSGGEAASARPVACAIEMMHTFSLIHDDLPCMDNDDMRRGRPSCHKAFGEANALLAGDALAILPGEIIAKAGLKGTISQGAFHSNIGKSRYGRRKVSGSAPKRIFCIHKNKASCVYFVLFKNNGFHFRYSPISLSSISANDRPIPFIMLGKRLCAVKPGIVFTSLNTILFSGV